MDYLPMKMLLEQVTRTAAEFLLGQFRREPDLLSLRSSAKEATTSYDKMADELIVQGIRTTAY